MAPTIRGAIYGITAAAIWGGMYVVSDVVLKTIPPFTLLSLRLILGTIVLLMIQRPILPSWPDRRRLLGVGLIGFGVSIGAQFVGTDLSTAVNGALITSASPAFILLFAMLVLGEQLTWSRILAVIIATIGVIIIVDPSKIDLGSDTFVGNVALAIAAITWGLYSVLVRLVSSRFDTLTVTLVAFWGGMILIFPMAALELSREEIGEITIPIVLGVLYLGVVSTAGAMWLWNRAFALVDANRASLFFFSQPVVGAGLGVLLLDQDLTANIAIGGALILLGVLWSIISAEKKADTQVENTA